MNPWFGVLAPAATSREIVARLNAEITQFLRTAEVARQLHPQGVDVAHASVEEFSALIKSDLEKWGKVIRDNGIRAE